jgi:phage gpG-like protein
VASKTPGVTFNPSLEAVAAALRTRIKKMNDRTAPNRRVAVVLDQWVQRNFQTEGGDVGGWTPFAAGGRYVPGIGLDTSAKLLQDTGLLRASFQSFYDADVVGIGSDLHYSKYHEEGTSTIPQRRMLPDEKDVMESILNVYNQWFSEIGEEPLW